MVERALTSCEFRRLKQVLQLSIKLRQKARDEIRGMMGVQGKNRSEVSIVGDVKVTLSIEGR